VSRTPPLRYSRSLSRSRRILTRVDNANAHISAPPRQNRFHESETLFSSIMNSPWFKNSQIILFLNKIDLLAAKLPQLDLRQILPEYDGPNDLGMLLNYLGKRLISQNQNVSGWENCRWWLEDGC